MDGPWVSFQKKSFYESEKVVGLKFFKLGNFLGKNKPSKLALINKNNRPKNENLYKLTFGKSKTEKSFKTLLSE